MASDVRLTAGAGGVVNVQLIEPGTQYGERTYQMENLIIGKAITGFSAFV